MENLLKEIKKSSMKRQCPNCNEKEVYYKFLASHKYMMCQTCGALYTYSKTMNLGFFITYISCFIITPVLWLSLLPIVVMFTGALIVIALILQYLPLKQIGNEDIAFTTPLKIDFEKTDGTIPYLSFFEGFSFIGVPLIVDDFIL